MPVDEDRPAGSDPTRTLLCMSLQSRQPESHINVSKHQLQGMACNAAM